MKEIILTKGYKTLVDDEDFEYLNGYKWHASVDLRKDGSVRAVYARRNIKTEKGQRRQSMHRLILNVVGTDCKVDHKDHNGLNNQKHNLRKATNLENTLNRLARFDNPTNYKGICFHKRVKKWSAKITIKGKQTHLGYFSNPEEAALTYNEAAVLHFKEFASVNQVVTPTVVTPLADNPTIF